MSGDDTLDCDLLVIGAGMAGLSAAGWAAEHGARVVVVEKAPQIGGSAALSGGVLWTATSPARMRLYGGGDAALADGVLQRYPQAIAWLRRRGVHVSGAMPVLHGRGYQIDILAHLQGCALRVEQAGGHVVRSTQVQALTVDPGGRVSGARTAHADGSVDVRARATLLASGGFQASPALRERYIHPNARDMLLRSNPHSTGDGLLLAQAVGAAVAAPQPGFYGHLVSASPAWGEPRLHTLLSQYHSDRSLLLNEAGQRFCDETLGDHASTWQTLQQPNRRALCVWDARVHAQHATQPVVAIATPMDRMAVALEHGGRGTVAAGLDQVAAFAAAEGFDGARVAQSIAGYNAACRGGWETLAPPRAEHAAALDAPPYYALVVHPAITFSYGGLCIDTRSRVLRPDGTAVAGLYAAGADAATAFGSGYAGGLALALTYGLAAAQAAGWGEAA